MRRLIILFTANLIITNLYCQIVQVNGALKDNNGEPLVGATVAIKGTNQGTVADINGNYTLNAPVGSILVVSFVGYLPKEFIVTKNGKAQQIKNKAVAKQFKSQAVKGANNYTNFKLTTPSYTITDTSEISHNTEKGIADMRSDMTYRITNAKYPDYSNLKFKGINNRKKKKVLVFENQNPRTIFLPRVSFNSSFAIETINKLPYLQQTYAQGRPESGESVWQGPEYGELFAWGPALSQMEYDGSSYAYDKHGRLVPAYDGDGTKALSYNPYDFFKNGYQLINSYRIEHRIRKIKYFVSFKHNNQKGIVPESQFNRNTLSSGLDYNLNKIALSGDLLFSNVQGMFASGSMMDYYIMRSVLLSPPSFDNSNDNDNDALSTRNTYYTPYNEQRSAASNASDNPYWLLNYTRDNMHSTRTMGKFDISYNLFQEAKANLSVYADNQCNSQALSFSGDSYIFTNGITDSRNSDLLTYGSNLNLNNLNFNLYNTKFSGQVFYRFLAEEVKLNRNTHFSNPIQIEDEAISNNYNTIRNTNTGNIRLNMDFNNYALLSVLGHQSNYSDIKNAAGFRGGALSGGILFSSFQGFRRHLDFIHYCKIYGSIGNNFSAPPLLADPIQYTSIKLTDEELSRFYSTREINYTYNLLPENHKSINLGLDMHFQYNKYGFIVEWYKNTIQNAILPQYNADGSIELKNLARLSSPGIDISAEFHHRINNWEFTNRLNFSKHKTIVEDIYYQDSIALAGFSFVSSNAIEGEPLGVLTGSKYQRDQNGNILIDEDGYPMVDSKPGKIGDPNPRFTLGFINNITYRNFELSLLWELRVGGKVWNGTRATLDYYGLSEETADNRNIRNYIFDGVTEDGTENVQPVDFANSNNNFETNRWVRYGITGVSEEYIEDGSWFRLRSLNLQYDMGNLFSNRINEFKVGIFVNNIILSQKYLGVDTESTLFSQPGGYGLDYFNKPSTSSYGITLAIKL